MDLHYKQEAAVGGLVLMALVLFVAGTMWLSGRSLGPGGGAVLVQFDDVGTLKRGNPVKISGVTLGSVQQIQYRGYGDVLVTLELEKGIEPRMDAAASLEAVGLVGDLQVDFNPGSAAQPLPPGRVIGGTHQRGLTEIGTELGGQARDVLTGIQEVANKRLSDDLHETLRALQRTLDLFANEKRGPTAELSATMQVVQQLSRRLDSTLASPALERTLTNFDTVTSRLAAVTTQFTTTGARLDTLLQHLQRGEGTMGRLATDSTLYVEMREATKSLRLLLEEINKHPGKFPVQIKIF